jgi:hypothetical protein
MFLDMPLIIVFFAVVFTAASLAARDPVAVIPLDFEIAGEGPVRRVTPATGLVLARGPQLFLEFSIRDCSVRKCLLLDC